MTQEQKELLLKDLCARLPYKVRCSFGIDDAIYEVCGVNPTCCGASEIQATHIKSSINGDFSLSRCKPYLFPLSSMTEEQKRELLELTGYEARCEESGGFDSWGFYVNIVGEYKYEDNQESIILYPDDIGIDWCNKNHFDYRGLIEKGLAIDATGLNIYE